MIGGLSSKINIDRWITNPRRPVVFKELHGVVLYDSDSHASPKDIVIAFR